MGFISTLIDRGPKGAEPRLPPGLQELYGGDLSFPVLPTQLPYVIGNFVSTLDGVVSYKIEGQSGGPTISGSDPADGFIVGLLRASADAVLVGAGSVHDVSPQELWIPEYTYPSAKQLFAEYRRNVLHKPEYPLVVIVSGSGRLDLTRAIFRTLGIRTVIITTSNGAEELAKNGAGRLSTVEVHALNTSGSSIDPSAIVQLLHSKLGVRLLLHEGGPTLFGQFLAAEMVDELFLTLAPQASGRAVHTARPGFVEGVEFISDNAPWFHLLSVKQRDNHLYFRYQTNRK